MLWVDPTDPEVLAAVAGSGLPDPVDAETQALVSRAVAIASEVLTLATGFLIHPAGEHTEENITRRLTRWSPLHGPVTSIESLSVVHPDGSETPVQYRKVGNTVHLLGSNGLGFDYSVPLWRINGVGLGAGQRPEHMFRLVYRVASTITPAARQAILDYAHEMFLLLSGNEDDCQLPERITSLDREGIGIQLATPQDYLDKGRTGIPKIDMWLAMINPKRALRPSAVYTPDSPPGVGVGVRRIP